MKKYVVWCIVLIAMILCSAASAEGTIISGDFEYTLSNGQARIQGYKGKEKSITIPATIDGYPVVALDQIGGSGSLEVVILSEGIEEIINLALFNSNIKEVYIPSTIKNIEFSSLYSKYGTVEKIEVVEANPYYKVVDGVLFSKSGDTLICYPSNLPQTTYTIPDEVVEIGRFAFRGNEKLKSIHTGKNSKLETIGSQAFISLNIEEVTLPDNLLSIETAAFAVCQNLKSITLPSNLSSIGGNTFEGCINLTEIRIPSKVTSLPEYRLLADCTNLGSVYLSSNISAIHASTFEGSDNVVVVTTEGSYAHQWCIDNSVAFRLEQPQDDYLEKLSVKSEDFETFTYLCMSKMSTLDFDTLHSAANKKADALWIVETGNGFSGPIWNKDNWGSRPISENLDFLNVSYDDLFRICLKDWKIVCQKENDETGFGGTVFQHKTSGEIVIAFRASGNLLDSDSYSTDWKENDFPLYFSNKIGPQLADARKLYLEIKKDFLDKKITLTGHSLGGGLAIGISTLYNEKARPFNSVPMLSNVFQYAPSLINQSFQGIDLLDHIDTISEHDVIAGLWDRNQKNHIALKDYVGAFDILPGKGFLDSHDLNALFSISKGEFYLNKVVYSNIHGPDSIVFFPVSDPDAYPVWRVDKPMGFIPRKQIRLVVGATGDQKISGNVATQQNFLLYAGDGDDEISTFAGNDILIGGKGNDIISGDTGEDQYIYTKGDGQDIIYDISGDTHIYLEGFEETDKIECRVNDSLNVTNKKTYHGIYCNGKKIISICMDRAASVFPSNNLATEGTHFVKLEDWLFVYKDGKVIKIADEERHTCTRYVFQCPVAIQIFDQNQRLIATIGSGENQSLFTEYGHFYVFEEEDGSYGKVIELFEGYSLKATGEDEGTLDLIVEDMGEDNPYSLGAQKIPIQKGSKITLNGNLLTGMQVMVDHDGDGNSDFEAQLTRDLVGAPTTTPPVTGDSTPLGLYWLFCTITFGLTVCFLKRSSGLDR